MNERNVLALLMIGFMFWGQPLPALLCALTLAVIQPLNPQRETTSKVLKDQSPIR